MSALKPGDEWKPDSAEGLARVQERNGRGTLSRRYLWLAAAAAAGSICLIVIASPRACAKPRGCGVGFWQNAVTKQVEIPRVTPVEPVAVSTAVAPVAPVQSVTPQPVKQPVAAKPAAAIPPAATVPANYKEAGSPHAAIVCEVYTDYECPACAALYRDVIPLLMAQYVLTGKVRLLHRDFPLTRHPFAVPAARYANAAGELGYYDVAVKQIFGTQNTWSLNGDIDSQVAKVLPPGVMEKVRQMVKSDSTLNNTMIADLTMGNQDNLTQTPSLVIVANGKRQLISGLPSFAILQSYLDESLAKH